MPETLTADLVTTVPSGIDQDGNTFITARPDGLDVFVKGVLLDATADVAAWNTGRRASTPTNGVPAVEVLTMRSGETAFLNDNVEVAIYDTASTRLVRVVKVTAATVLAVFAR